MSRLPRPKVVFFDAGGTLLSVSPGVAEIYAEVAAERFGRHYRPRRLAESFRRAFVEAQAALRERRGFVYGRSEAEALEFWRELIARVAADQRDEAWTRTPEFDAYVAALFDEFRRPERWRLEPSALELFRALRERGVAVGVLSNWDARLEPLLGELGVLEWVDCYAASHATGLEKPDLMAFKNAASLAGAAPAEAWHVGDSRSQDCAPARKAGYSAAFRYVGTKRRSLLALLEEDGRYPALASLAELLDHMEA